MCAKVIAKRGVWQHMLKLFQIFDTPVWIDSSSSRLSEPTSSLALKVTSFVVGTCEMAQLPATIASAMDQAVDADDSPATSTARPKSTTQ